MYIILSWIISLYVSSSSRLWNRHHENTVMFPSFLLWCPIRAASLWCLINISLASVVNSNILISVEVLFCFPHVACSCFKWTKHFVISDYYYEHVLYCALEDMSSQWYICLSLLLLCRSTIITLFNNFQVDLLKALANWIKRKLSVCLAQIV